MEGARPRPGIRDVAERAGVAISSVSRVLSGHADVSPEMRERVLAAVDELGYRTDFVARGLRSRSTMSIGYVVSNISNPIVADIVTGAESRLRASGFSLLLTNSEGSSAFDADNIRLLQQRRVDGMLLSLAREDNPETAPALQEVDVPVVLVDRDVPSGVSVRSIGFDHRAGMATAARHLIELGHRNVAVIVGGPRRPARERWEGVRETFRTVRGARCQVYDGDFSIQHGIAATLRVLGQEPRPTAIIAGGNLLMQGSLRALHDQRIRVGPDMSFIGCDDNTVAELHEPQIAVVRRDTRALGVAAAELLLDALRGGPVLADGRMLPTEFVARPSCTVPRG